MKQAPFSEMKAVLFLFMNRQRVIYKFLFAISTTGSSASALRAAVVPSALQSCCGR